MVKELKLSADYIPPSLMQTMEWYVPVRSGFTWFYHESRLSFTKSAQTPVTYLDPLLRPIIIGLNELNIETLASCQGHFYSSEDYRRIREILQEDERLIRTEGLRMRNLHTQEVVLYQDPNYCMPIFSELAEEMRVFSGVGYFSYIAHRGDDLVLLNLTREIGRCPRVRMTFAPNRECMIVNVQVDTTEENHEETWTQLTTRVMHQLSFIPKKRDIRRPFTLPDKINPWSGEPLNTQVTELVFYVAVLSFLVSTVFGFYILRVSTYTQLPNSTQHRLMFIAIATVLIALIRFVRRLRFYNQLKEMQDS